MGKKLSEKEKVDIRRECVDMAIEIKNMPFLSSEDNKIKDQNVINLANAIENYIVNGHLHVDGK